MKGNKNMNTKLSVVLACLLGASPVIAQTKALSLEDRVAELEASQSLNMFTFGGFLGTRYDDVNVKQTTPAATAFEGHTQHWRLTGGINANANVSNKIKFYSTSAISKNFNSWNSQTAGAGTSATILSDPTDSRAEKGSQIYLEKIYADYKLTDSLVFSFGRLPTMDGPPSEMALGNARMGTYPSVGYNAPFDGFALSYNMPMEKQNLAFRVLYTPFTYYTTTVGKLAGNAPEGLGNVTINGTKINSETAFGAAMVEYGIDGTAVANKINVMLFAYQTGNLPIDGSQLSVGAGGSGLVEFKVGGQVLTTNFSGIAGSDFDLSLTYFQSKVDNSGDINVTGLGHIYGFGAVVQGDSLSGSTKLISARYKLGNTFIGAEYLDGGKSVFNYDPATEVINGFYSTTGTGSHAYVTHKLTPELALRLGYMKQDYKSTPFTFGASSDTDRTIATIYSSLRLDF
ncbi:MAG: DUF3373 family protein [Pseudobdellovibrio sp.]